ncbi:signal peptidase II [Bosea sp. BE271]|mgnify:CR=1 FL=1|uniref:signal peptidase II n=1 Tax=Bosea TaxID=85413 RepID=UPI002865DB3A|nr:MULTISPECIES: signal peptidase II [Bosea]MDR6826332.1 signal peptidase II [Bosea robiniae]MDR6893042.1 signal peptidase II [Bosea sp. BE109]MDR7137260.1 signal peptidase II [Bosea sp. BE168]MDR7173960.1 signal peptidase II [Bosea sp. BE271]
MRAIARRVFGIVAIATLALVLDQASKWLMLEVVMDPPRTIPVTPFFNLRLGFNTGISFGLFGDTLQRWPELLAIFKLAVAIAFIVWASTTIDPYERFGLALIAGGALGNAVDRWRQGAVTDFLDFYWGDWHWPTFNGADIAISLGVVTILYASLTYPRRLNGDSQEKADPAPEHTR